MPLSSFGGENPTPTTPKLSPTAGDAGKLSTPGEARAKALKPWFVNGNLVHFPRSIRAELNSCLRIDSTRKSSASAVSWRVRPYRTMRNASKRRKRAKIRDLGVEQACVQ